MLFFSGICSSLFSCLHGPIIGCSVCWYLDHVIIVVVFPGFCKIVYICWYLEYSLFLLCAESHLVFLYTGLFHKDISYLSALFCMCRARDCTTWRTVKISNARISRTRSHCIVCWKRHGSSNSTTISRTNATYQARWPYFLMVWRERRDTKDK